MLIYWMAIQILGGLSEVGAGEGGGVAFWAHAGGFIVGAVLIKVFATNARVQEHASHHFRPRRVGWD
jgi:membrane associated rhomboid family serine protease